MELYEKKVRIDAHLSEKLINVENSTRLINSLLENYFSGKLIILTDENKTTINAAAIKLEKSCEDVINQLIASIEIEVKKEKPKKKIELGRKLVHQKKNYVLDI